MYRLLLGGYVITRHIDRIGDVREWCKGIDDPLKFIENVLLACLMTFIVVIKLMTLSSAVDYSKSIFCYYYYYYFTFATLYLVITGFINIIFLYIFI